MLAFLLAQVASGLMSDDEISAAGPLTRFVSSIWVGNATFYHKEIGKLGLLVLVVAHLCAIAFYFLRRRENLVRPMLTGDKALSFTAQSASDTAADRGKALVVLVVCAAVVATTVTYLG